MRIYRIAGGVYWRTAVLPTVGVPWKLQNFAHFVK